MRIINLISWKSKCELRTMQIELTNRSAALFCYEIDSLSTSNLIASGTSRLLVSSILRRHARKLWGISRPARETTPRKATCLNIIATNSSSPITANMFSTIFNPFKMFFDNLLVYFMNSISAGLSIRVVTLVFVVRTTRKGSANYKS